MQTDFGVPPSAQQTFLAGARTFWSGSATQVASTRGSLCPPMGRAERMDTREDISRRAGQESWKPCGPGGGSTATHIPSWFHIFLHFFNLNKYSAFFGFSCFFLQLFLTPADMFWLLKISFVHFLFAKKLYVLEPAIPNSGFFW